MDKYHMYRRSDRFYKRCQKSLIFTPKRLSSLVNRGVVDASDLISLVFLTCDQCRMGEMLERLVDLKNLPTFDMYNAFRSVENWERKLFEALICIDNRKALLELSFSSATVECNSRRLLSQPRVVLYRIFENLCSHESIDFINKMEALSASSNTDDESCLEICFMRWQADGFIDIESQRGFEHVANVLNSIGRSDLATTLGCTSSSNWCPDGTLDFDYPLDVYKIKDENNPGLCVIINQQNYGNVKTNRRSSARDVDRLKTVLTSLKYSVVDYEDVSAADFLNVTNQAIVDNFTDNHSILVMIVMAHGGDGFITCPAKTVSLSSSHVETFDDKDNLMAEETSTEKFLLESHDVFVEDIQKCLLTCKILHSVPKMLISNSCRGSRIFRNRGYFRNTDYVADEYQVNETHSHIDLITCYTTLPGHLNFRDKHQGSLFMQVFCDILSNRPDIEATELFTLINARLMVPTAALSKDFEVVSGMEKIEIANPCDFTSCLTKKLYLSTPVK